MPATPCTSAWPPSLPSVPTSRATRVTSAANERSWSTIVLMVFFSSRISPLTSTVIFLLRSPAATAVVTSAMLRTWLVRLPAMKLTLSVKSFQVPATPCTSAWPPSLPSVPTSRATRVTSAANERNWSTIVLMVFFSSEISPLTPTVIFLERSPAATAVVTSAMLRTCEVRLPAMKFTDSVKSFQVPATPCTSAWPPSLPSVPTSRATRVTSAANDDSWSTIVLTVFFSSRISPLTSTVIFLPRSPAATALVTSAMLRTCEVRLPAMKLTLSVKSFQVPATPCTSAWPPSLPSVPTSRATRVTSAANERNWSTIVLMVAFSSRISPLTSTVIFLDRSPAATALVTSAMLRTWLVRLPAIELTESVRSFQVPETPFTSAWPPSRPSVPTSRATRVTSAANDDSWSTIVLMVAFNSRISPLTSTVIFSDRLPAATALVTSAMLRTWLVRFDAIEFTESVKSFQVPATPCTSAWPPSLPSVPTSRATRVTSAANERSWSTIVLMVFFSSEISPLTSTVIFLLRSPAATAVVTSAMLRTWLVRLPAMKLTLSVKSFQVPATPCTSAWPPRLPSVPTSRATRVTSAANERNWSTIVLTVFFSSRISPLTSTVIFLERSPAATALVTSAMLRTWLVRLPAIELTESVRSFQVPDTPSTRAWPPSEPSVPTSRATRVTSEANERSWSTIVLMVFFSVRNSPLTSTSIFLERSPLATAVVTSAMLRTCAVRLPAIELTESVRSFQVPATPLTVAWPPSLPSVPTSRATRVTSAEKLPSWSTILLIVCAVRRNSPSSGRLSTSSAMLLLRSPWATAPITRATSLVGCTRSSISELIDIDRFAPEAARLAQRRALLELALLAHHLAQPPQLVGHRGVLLDHLVEGVGHPAGHARPVQRQAHARIALAQRHQCGQQRVQLVGLESGRHFHDRHGGLLVPGDALDSTRVGAACTFRATAARHADCRLTSPLRGGRRRPSGQSCQAAENFAAGSVVDAERIGSRSHWPPRQESNLYLALRRRSFYPLNYGGCPNFRMGVGR